MQKTTTPLATKSPFPQYALLAIICLAAALYQVRLTKDVLRDEKVDLPFFYPQMASASIDFSRSETMAGEGLHRSDMLIAINGRPYTGTAVLGQELAKATPGTSLAVTVRFFKSGVAVVHTVELPVTRSKNGAMAFALDLLLHIAMPVFCLLLGAWVVIARPRDLPAWLLFGLLLSFPQIFEIYKVPGWEPGFRELGMIYHTLLARAWPIFMCFF